MSTQLSHQSHLEIAQEIHEDILNICDETVESIDKLNNESAADQLYLLREANIYADDLNSVVCHLAQVAFKIDKSNKFHSDLLDIITNLCTMTADIHRSFQRDHETVKTELKNNIKTATKVAELLLTIIRADDFHELKQELLDNQADVLFAVYRVYYTNMLKYQSPQELEDLTNDQLKDLKTIFVSLDLKDPNIQQKIIQSTNHSLYKHQGITNHIQKAIISDHFNDEIKNLFLDFGNDVDKYVADMHKLFLGDSQVDELIDDAQKLVTDFVTTLKKLLTLLTTNDKEKVPESGMELLVYAYSYGASCIYQLLRSLQYVKSDN